MKLQTRQRLGLVVPAELEELVELDLAALLHFRAQLLRRLGGGGLVAAQGELHVWLDAFSDPCNSSQVQAQNLNLKRALPPHPAVVRGGLVAERVAVAEDERHRPPRPQHRMAVCGGHDGRHQPRHVARLQELHRARARAEEGPADGDQRVYVGVEPVPPSPRQARLGRGHPVREVVRDAAAHRVCDQHALLAACVAHQLLDAVHQVGEVRVPLLQLGGRAPPVVREGPQHAHRLVPELLQLGDQRPHQSREELDDGHARQVRNRRQVAVAGAAERADFDPGGVPPPVLERKVPRQHRPRLDVVVGQSVRGVPTLR
mmetsp:Transcript_8626/g.28417  ORF Transcript_8626/g.28417 Transcript_8626/m.28417 type:complete len:316 (+) Transcript_8626:2042-2989(+)